MVWEKSYLLVVRAMVVCRAQAVVERPVRAGPRAELSPRPGEIDFRGEIRDASGLEVPYMALVAQREAGEGTVSLGASSRAKWQVTLPVEEEVERLRREAEGRGLSAVALEGAVDAGVLSIELDGRYRSTSKR